jgi:outer membrane protein assembly factor BamB
VLGTSGDLLALKADGGEIVWQRNLPEDFGGQMMSGWRYSESPLIDGPRLICTPGGPQATMAALDKNTGQTIWTCSMPEIGPAGKDGAGYSSAVVAEIGGVRQYVQMLGRGVIGVEAESGRFPVGL